MSTRRSRIASFRGSVISVVAAFAPAAGCSLDHNHGTQPHSMNPPVCDTPGCVPGCPSEAPAASSECTTEGQTCDYGPCGSDKHATCQDGEWQITGSSCNPPPQSFCPEAIPTRDGACTDEGLECSYTGDCDIDVSASCRDGKWDVSVVSCNPPANVCPQMQPTDGDPCTLPSTQECVFATCGDLPQITGTCVDSIWRISENSCNPPAQQCPDAVPDKGTECGGFGENQTCMYGDCATGPAFTAVCTEGSWQVTPNSCNPPPVVQCPADVPKADTGCELPADQFCKYGPCGGTVATCPAGVWTIALIDLDCPPPTTMCPEALPVNDTLCNYTGDPCSYSQGGDQYSAQCVAGKWSVNGFGLPD